MKTVFLFFVCSIIQAGGFQDTDIVGVWESRGAQSGNLFGLNLKKDGTFSSYINKKAFTSGHYTYSKGLFSFTEVNGCKDSSGGKITAVTRLVFFASDSFRIEVVNDSCTGRGKAVEGSRYGRVKKST